MPLAIAIAADHAGVDLKAALVRGLTSDGYDVTDLGTQGIASVDYPDYAKKLADWMKDKKESAGILICGSGIGMSIAANRQAHIRAALVATPEHAALARAHNDANVICLGARHISEITARNCVDRFLTTPFAGGRHEMRVKKL